MGPEQEAASLQALQAPAAAASGAKAPLCRWQRRTDGDGLELLHQHPVKHVAWHARGEYFASVAPTGNTQVHTPRLWSPSTSDPSSLGHVDGMQRVYLFPLHAHLVEVSCLHAHPIEASPRTS